MYKKKNIFTVACLSLTFMLLAGCQKEEVPEEPPEEILEYQEIMSVLSLDMPVSFSIEDVGSEENLEQVRYVNVNYPEDLSNICFERKNADVKMALLTADIVKKQTEDIYKTVYLEDIEVDVNSFKRESIDEYDAILVSTEYTVNDIKVVRKECTVTIGDYDYSVTYTDAHENAWEEVFEKSIDTIHVIK